LWGWVEIENQRFPLTEPVAVNTALPLPDSEFVTVSKSTDLRISKLLLS